MSVVLILSLSISNVQAADTVGITFNDANLESSIRQALNKPSGSITAQDLTSLISLDASNSGIHDLSGLENAVNLQVLNLDNNEITSISAINNLKNLHELNLCNNKITDISSVSQLISLNKLSLRSNPLGDLSPIKSLISLTSLDLSHTGISDLSFLPGLTNLQQLYLYNNNIGDISYISNLKNLVSLNLSLNNISDISSLSGISSIKYLDLDINNISDISYLAPLTNLQNISLYNNNISDISSLTNLIKLSKVNLGCNNITDISPLISNNQKGGLQAGSELDIRWNYLNLTVQNTNIQTLIGKGINLLISPQDDNASPKITYITPEANTNNIDLTSNINIYFNENIQKDVSFNNIYITCSAGKVSTTCSIIGNSLVISPSSQLKSNTTYTVVIPTSSVKDLSGNSFKSDFTFSFTTIDTVPLLLQSTSPANNSSKISVNNAVNLYFSKTIKLSSNYSNIKITDDNANLVDSSTLLNDNILTIIPKTSLNYNETYTVTIPQDSISDLNNNELSSDITFKFSTKNSNDKDVNQDGKVDVLDLAALGIHYNTTAYNSSWDSDYDINGDGIIDLYDLILVSKNIK